MERKVFYTLVGVSEIEGLMKQDGFEVNIGETIFYAYIAHGTVYIIDPKNGYAIFTYRGWHDYDDDVSVSDMVKVERAIKKFRESEDLKIWKAARDKESYIYTNKMFDALMDARKYREKLKELAAELESDGDLPQPRRE